MGSGIKQNENEGRMLIFPLRKFQKMSINASEGELMSDFLFLYFALIEISCTWGRRGEKSPFWKFCGCFKIRRRFFKFNDYSNWKMETFLCVHACADDFQLNFYPSSRRAIVFHPFLFIPFFAYTAVYDKCIFS